MFTLTINTENDAFADGNCAYEVARICREVSNRLARGNMDGKVMDANGNTVGAYAYHEGEHDAPQAGGGLIEPRCYR